MHVRLSSAVGSSAPPVRPGEAAVHWTALDTLLIVLVTIVAGALRLDGITHPAALVFDEFYASDACLYVLVPQPQCAVTAEISVVHPPLGKWLIGAGIQALGFTPAGWRVAPLIAGTLTVAVLYLLARRLLGSSFAALLAAGLLAFDPLHYLMSRTAMLDVFVVFFGLIAFLCLVYDSSARRPDRSSHPAMWHTGLGAQRWLIGAGLAGGAAAASKWSGGYLLLGVGILAVLHRTVRVGAHQKPLRRTIRHETMPAFFALVLVPAVVYISSFVGRVEGAFMAWPWTPESWLHGLIERHQAAFQHHTGALYTHPYMSPPWSWPLVKRPVLFYVREVDSGHLQEMLALGNPLVWWIALAALGVIAGRMLYRAGGRWRSTVVLTGFLAGYLPWFIITRQESFLYYFLPAVPFMYLGLAHVTAAIRSRRARAVAAGGLAAMSIAMFAFFLPLLRADTVSYEDWERRIWFQDCGPGRPESQKKPITRPTPPPAGWCWL